MAKDIPLYVPPEEQPYPIPANWRWYYAPHVFNIVYGKGLGSKQLTETGYPVFGANGQIGFYTDYLYEEQKAVMSCRGAYSGYMNLTLPFSYVTNNSLIIEGRFKDIDPNLIYYLFSSLDVRPLITGSAQPQVTVNSFSKFPIPLPPFPEQQRIVDRIRSLFTKLDAARDKAQSVLAGYELRRAAILHRAFTGELTKKWRAEHGVGLDSWQEKRFDDCIHKMQNGIAKRTGETGSPYVVLRLANLSDEGFVTVNLREILLDEKEQANYELHENDAIMVRVNGSRDNVGKQYLISNQKKWAFCDHIIRIVYNQNVLPAYMLYFSKGIRYRLYIDEHMVTTAGQNTISRKGMSSLFVPVPQITEQREIVRILDTILAAEQRTKENAETVIKQIDTMKKKILGLAFRGKLGANDPMEASAAELLEQIRKP